MGYTEVEVIILDLDEEQKKAYRLVHNQLTMNTDWDIEMLKEELSKIDINMNELGFEQDLLNEVEEEFTEVTDDEFDVDTATDLIDYAKNLQTVTVYLYGGNNPPYKTDCSGWTQHIYSKFGITLPRVSKQQANVGTPITFKNMKKGDLMFFSSREDKVINHVGIYLGDGYWISNLNSKYSVKIESVWSNYCQKYFLWAQRVI